MTPSTGPSLLRTRLPIILIVLVLVAACGGAASAPGPGRLDTVGSAADGGTAFGPAEQPQGQPAPGSGNAAGPVILDAARPDLLIIKTGTLELQVKDVGPAVTTATSVVAGLGGYVSGSQQGGEGDALTATVTFRIPSDRWDDALTALKSLARKVVTEQTQTQDVTGQVVDLTARIKNLQTTEQALQAIMTQATKITDVLAVQTELTKVRGDIEQATAEKQHLQEQASFSTLAVRFGLQPTPAVEVSQKNFNPTSQVDQATASLVDILQGLATAGIWFAIVWLPILIVLGIIGLIVLTILRRRDRRAVMVATAAGPSSPPEPTAPADSTPGPADEV